MDGFVFSLIFKLKALLNCRFQQFSAPSCWKNLSILQSLSYSNTDGGSEEKNIRLMEFSDNSGNN